MTTKKGKKLTLHSFWNTPQFILKSACISILRYSYFYIFVVIKAMSTTHPKWHMSSISSIKTLVLLVH